MPADTGPAPARDPGLQPERTRLAWRRTTLSCTVVAVLAAREAVRHGATAAAVTAGSLSALVWVGFLVVAHRRSLALNAPQPPRLPVREAVAAAVCALALAAFAVSFVV